MIRLFLQVFCAIFSGIMQAFSISNETLPFGSPFLALFCLVPFYKCLFSARSYSESFWLFFLQAISVHLTSSFWLANFHGFAVFTLGASALGTAFEAGLCGIAFHLSPSLAEKNAKLLEINGLRVKNMAYRALWFSSCIVLWEWIKSSADLGYPWGTISMAAYKWKLITQIADTTGVWGITFLFCLANSVFAEFPNFCENKFFARFAQNEDSVKCEFKSILTFTASLFVLSLFYGTIQYFLPRTPEKFVDTIIVQQNIDPWEGGDKTSIPISMTLTEEKVLEMRSNGIEPDLVLWSEGVLNNIFPTANSYYKYYPESESLRDFIDRMDVPFIIGGTVRMNRQKRRYANSAILFDKDGNFAGFYSKKHLVPFAEQIPYAENPLMNAFMKNVVGFTSSLSSGKEFVLFEIPLKPLQNESPLEENLKRFAKISLNSDGMVNFDESKRYLENTNVSSASVFKFTVPICFEDAFSDVCRPLFNMGSEAFFNITNDSWSKMPSAEYQHFIVASFLAIEYRTTLLRCANSGYSVVVNPSGKIIADIPVFTYKALGVSVPIYVRKATIYSQAGDWFPIVLLICVAIFFVANVIRIHSEKIILTNRIKIYITIKRK